MSPTYVKIFSGSPITVIALKDALNRADIIPIVKDNAESARLAGFGVPSNIQEVFVHPDELDTAIKIRDRISL